ncbi:MAG: BON domain-containing protein [Chroococcales cyanobacterium]
MLTDQKIFISILLLFLMACSNVAKTSVNAPDSVETNGEIPDLDTVLSNKSDALSAIRRAQANADIRAREQRYNWFGFWGDRNDSDIESEVRSKLEVNIPGSQLAVESQEGMVIVSGIVSTYQELKKITPLAQEIRGVKDVYVRATVGINLPPNHPSLIPPKG